VIKPSLAASFAVCLVAASPVFAQEEFTELHDLIPDRCFSAPLSVVAPGVVDIGIESGYNSTTWQNKACIASTRSFHSGAVSDTFTVTVTAPAGMRIARVRYEQVGSAYEERANYWTASGTGTFTVNEIAVPFSFTAPTLVRVIDLTGQDVASANVLVSISLSAKRNSAHPRVKAAPGSATISVTDAVIRVEYEPQVAAQ
jgi:hypothetical protein